MKKIFILTIVFFTPLIIADKLKINQFKLAGSACNTANTSVTVDPDNETISILFDELIAEAPQFKDENDNDQFMRSDRGLRRNSHLYDYKLCHLSLDSLVPEGQKIDSIIIYADFRGAVYTEEGASASFESKLVSSIAPGRKIGRSRQIIGSGNYSRSEYDEDIESMNKKEIKINSACSKPNDNILKLTFRNLLKAKVLPRYEELGSIAMISLDSADLVTGMKIKLNTSKCSQSPAAARATHRVSRSKCNSGEFFHSILKRCIKIPSRNR